MINLSTLLKPDSIISDIDVNSKKRVLEILAELLSLHVNIEENANDETAKNENSALQIFQLLIEREKLGSTGMGHGVALPHARTDRVKQATGAFIKLKQGVDFDSPDKQPTDLIFALLVPEHCTEQHLQILASLASTFSDTVLCKAIRASSSADEIYNYLTTQALTSQAS